MVTKIEGGTAQFSANVADETFLLGADDTLIVTGAEAINAVDTLGAGVGGRLFRIDGTVISSSTALTIENNPAEAQDRVRIGSTGLVFGSNGVEIAGGRARVENAGEIDARDDGIGISDGIKTVIVNSGSILVQQDNTTGIRADTDSLVLDNSGLVKAENAAIFASGAYDIVNSGRLDGGVVAFTLAATSTGGTLVNTGVLRGNGDAIFIGSSALDGGVHSITNRGRIIGDIDLSGSGSDDVVDTSGGKVFGGIFTGAGADRILLRNGALVVNDIAGGDGDDTYIIGGSDFGFDEGVNEGTDTIRSSVTFSLFAVTNIENLVLTGVGDINATGNIDDNSLTGNAGDNALSGLRGDDTLDGGKGKDVLGLGEGIDTIIFRTGDGKDTVNDFTAEDLLDLSDLKAITSFDDLIDNHAKEVGANLVIKAGADEIKLLGLTLDDIAEGQFLF